MTRWRLLPILLVWLAPVVLPVPAHAQDGSRTVSADLLARWERLSPEEKQLVMQRFEKWKKLSPDQQDELADRHQLLGKAREEVLTTLPEAELRHIERLRHHRERNSALKPHLSSFFEQERRRVLELAGLPEPAGAKLSFSQIRKLSKEYTAERLRQLEEDGHLQEGEADRLLALPPRPLKRALREIQKRLTLQHPPKPFLTLPGEERERIMKLDPERFMKEVHRLRGDRNPQDLPPMMKDLLRGRRRPPPRPLPDQLLRRILGPEQFEQVRDLPGEERRSAVARLLREKARAALEARGEDPHALDALDDLSPEEKERRLAEIIAGPKSGKPQKAGNGRRGNGPRRPEGARRGDRP